MKRVAIFLRKDIYNKFRRTILETLSSAAVDEALLCSGFFQDTTNYRAGFDFDVFRHRCSTPLTLTIMGLYSYSWKQQFMTFSQAVKRVNNYPNFRVYQKRMRGMKWHAKIFIAKENGRPVVAIIGSSNITSKAFGEFKSFNYESDVVFWDEKNPTIDRILESIIGDGPESRGVIVTNYDESHRANKTPLAERILKLEQEIFDMSVNV